MLKTIFWLIALCVLLLIAVLLLGQSGLLARDRPLNLGVNKGLLKPPSSTRNSVSSQASLHTSTVQTEYADIEALSVEGDAQSAILKLKDVLQSLPGVRVIQTRPDYLYAEARSKWMGFVDDIEFWYNPALHRIELRSASRIGREDFGVNRKRIEKIRQLYLSKP